MTGSAFGLRRPVAAIFGVLVAVLLAVGAQSMAKPGVVLWSDLSSGLVLTGLITNPLIAGLFAWEATSRGVAIKVRAQTTVRPNSLPLILDFLQVMVWIVGGGIVGFGITSIWGLTQQAYGQPVWLWLLSGGSGALVCAAFGYTVGLKLKSRWYVAPLAAAAIFLGRILVAGLPFWIVQAYPSTLNTTNPFVEYVNSTFAAQILWYLGLIGVMFLVLVAGPIARSKVKVGLLAVSLVAAIAGLAILSSTHGQITRGYNARDYECREDSVNICVHRAYSNGLDELEVAFSNFNTRAAGTSLVATRLEQNVGGVGDVVSPGARDLYLEDLGPHFADNAVFLYEQTYGGIQTCTDGESGALHSVVDAWLLDQQLPDFGFPMEITNAPTAFWKLDEAGRRTWLQLHERQVLECTLKFEDMSL